MTTQTPECLLPRPQKTENVNTLSTDLLTPDWVYLSLVDWGGGSGKERIFVAGSAFLNSRL